MAKRKCPRCGTLIPTTEKLCAECIRARDDDAAEKDLRKIKKIKERGTYRVEPSPTYPGKIDWCEWFVPSWQWVCGMIKGGVQ